MTGALAVMFAAPPAVVLRLPAPPSTNRLWRPATGRAGFANTKLYRAWRDEAGWEVQRQRAGDRFLGRYAMRLRLPPGLDIDNHKAVSDLLQRQGVVLNDAHCEALLVERDRSREDGSALVELWPVDGPPVPPRRRPHATRPPRRRAHQPDMLGRPA